MPQVVVMEPPGRLRDGEADCVDGSHQPQFEEDAACLRGVLGERVGTRGPAAV